MKLLITTTKVRKIFTDSETDFSLLCDPKTLNNILSEREKAELSYVIYEVNEYLSKNKNPLTDTLRLLENISLQEPNGVGGVCTVEPGHKWYDTSLMPKSNLGTQTTQVKHPVIHDVEMVGSNTILLVLCTRLLSADDYMERLITDPLLNRSLPYSKAETLLNYFMRVKGINEGLKTSLKTFLLSKS